MRHISLVVRLLIIVKLFSGLVLAGVVQREMVQRAAARVVLCIVRRDHRIMTAALSELHWLPIAQRIECKVLTLMHGAVHNGTPQYLSDRISTFRSESQSLAVVPRINLEHYGRRAFSCAGPTLWNALPLNLRTQQDPARFRRDLKTYIFNVAFLK